MAQTYSLPPCPYVGHCSMARNTALPGDLLIQSEMQYQSHMKYSRPISIHTTKYMHRKTNRQEQVASIEHCTCTTIWPTDPWDFWVNFQKSQFQWLMVKVLLWNYHQMNVIGPLWWYVNIGFRLWLGAIRQLAIQVTSGNVEPNLWCYMVSLGHNELTDCSIKRLRDKSSKIWEFTKFAPNIHCGILSPGVENGGHWHCSSRSFWPFWLKILAN